MTMTEEELDAEHEALRKEQEDLDAERRELDKHPSDRAGHLAYVQRLRNHADRQQRYMNARWMGRLTPTFRDS
jgi:hypothetical protein